MAPLAFPKQGITFVELAKVQDTALFAVSATMVDSEQPLASTALTVYEPADNEGKLPVVFETVLGKSVYVMVPVPPADESVIDPFVLPLHNGFTVCAFVHANKVGDVIEAVIVLVQPMLLLIVTV